MKREWFGFIKNEVKLNGVDILLDGRLRRRIGPDQQPTV